jgi:hypothetical protein
MEIVWWIADVTASVCLSELCLGDWMPPELEALVFVTASLCGIQGTVAVAQTPVQAAVRVSETS